MITPDYEGEQRQYGPEEPRPVTLSQYRPVLDATGAHLDLAPEVRCFAEPCDDGYRVTTSWSESRVICRSRQQADSAALDFCREWIAAMGRDE